MVNPNRQAEHQRRSREILRGIRPFVRYRDIDTFVVRMRRDAYGVALDRVLPLLSDSTQLPQTVIEDADNGSVRPEQVPSRIFRNTTRNFSGRVFIQGAEIKDPDWSIIKENHEPIPDLITTFGVHAHLTSPLTSINYDYEMLYTLYATLPSGHSRYEWFKERARTFYGDDTLSGDTILWFAARVKDQAELKRVIMDDRMRIDRLALNDPASQNL